MVSENRENPNNVPAANAPDYRSPREIRRDLRRQNPYRGLFWGLILILLGVLFFAAAQDWLSDDSAGELFLVGLGAVFLIDGLVHYVNPQQRSGASGRFIAGIIIAVVGLAAIFGLNQWWPLVLIAAGIAVLSGVWLRSRKPTA